MSSESIDQLLSELNHDDPTIPAWAALIINGMKVILTELKSMNETLNNKIEIIESDLAVSINVSSKLELETVRLNGEIVKLQTRVDDNEQRNRNLCLLIHGVVETPQEKTDDIVIDIVNNKIGVDLSVVDIERSHRLGVPKHQRVLRSSQSRTRPRPIIFRFSSYRKRDEVFRKKKALKGEGISISENLTKSRYLLYQEAIRKLGLGKVWSQEGRIMTKYSDRYIVLTNSKDIDEILPPLPE
jgi:hypothetical protein